MLCGQLDSQPVVAVSAFVAKKNRWFTIVYHQHIQIADRVAAAAQRYGMPTVSHLKAYARAGLLLTYGTMQDVYFPRAVVLADKILKGEKPGDLPIERPDRFELVINLKTAKTLGLTIPQSLLLRADDVIR